MNIQLDINKKLYKFGFIGEMGSGKTTAAEVTGKCMRNIFGSENVSGCLLKFANPIYETVNSLGVTGEKPRQFMQRYGDLCRTELGDDIFERAFEKKYNCTLNELCNEYNLIVCDDVRFLGEADLLKRLGFKLVKVEAERGVRQERIGMTFKNETHRSEVELTKIVPDIVVYNNRDIEYLKSEIEKLIVNY